MTEFSYAILTRPEVAVPIIVALLIAVGVTASSLAVRAASTTQTKADRLLRGVNLYGAPLAIVMTYFVVTFNGARDPFWLIVKIVLISSCVVLTALLALAELALTRSLDRDPHQHVSPTPSPTPTPAQVRAADMRQVGSTAPSRARISFFLVGAAGIATAAALALRRRR